MSNPSEDPSPDTSTPIQNAEPTQEHASAPPNEENDPDPILTSYTIYLTDSQIRRLLLQYPDRPSTVPYNTSTSQKPLSLRLKPRTGLIEVDVPINTQVNYDTKKGLRYGNSLRRSRVVREGGALGLAGGFNAGGTVGGAGKGGGRGGVKGEDEEGDGYGYEGGEGGEDDEYEREEADRRAGVLLGKQTLGGRIKPAVEGDPLYMLGAFRGDELHLAPLSAVVQLRPQLHHLDAFDDVTKWKTTSSSRSRKDATVDDTDPTPRAAPTEPEARTIDMKVKSAESDPDPSLKGNNDLLKRMQDEKWDTYNWIDERDQESWDKYEEFMFNREAEEPVGLEAGVGGEDYLDGMSAPRIDPTRPEMTGWAMKARRKGV
ncbi:hypothetical protein FQN54_009916 [Arachnomyces sp. PD_36]|nr:hypothetical protein FQN54_009916 [Arachnomyces sp. PD_36]